MINSLVLLQCHLLLSQTRLKSPFYATRDIVPFMPIFQSVYNVVKQYKCDYQIACVRCVRQSETIKSVAFWHQGKIINREYFLQQITFVSQGQLREMFQLQNPPQSLMLMQAELKKEPEYGKSVITRRHSAYCKLSMFLAGDQFGGCIAAFVNSFQHYGE